MEDFNFLPSIELVLTDQSQHNQNDYGISNSKNEINMARISEYIQIVLNIKVRQAGSFVNHIRFFRPCRGEDFLRNGLRLDDQRAVDQYVRHRVCPDITERDPLFKVVNGYSNQEYRQSFSLELWKCNS